MSTDNTLFEITTIAISHFKQRMADRGMIVKHVAVDTNLEFTRVEAGVPYLSNMMAQPKLNINLAIEETTGRFNEDSVYNTQIQYNIPFRVFTDDEVRNTFNYTKKINVKNYSEKEQKIFAILYVLIRGYDYVKIINMPARTSFNRGDIEKYVTACVYEATTSVRNI